MKSQQSGRGEVVVSRGHPYAAECNRGNVLHGKYGVGGEEAMPVLCGRIWLSFRLKSFWHLEHVVSVSAYVSKDFIPLSPVHLCLQVEALIDGWALSKLAERSSWILCLLIEWAPLKSKTQCAQWGALLCLLLASSAAPHWSYCWLRKCRLLSVCFFFAIVWYRCNLCWNFLCLGYDLPNCPSSVNARVKKGWRTAATAQIKGKICLFCEPYFMKLLSDVTIIRTVEQLFLTSVLVVKLDCVPSWPVEFGTIY